ncbi:MAG TPA: CBS domain-containing protein [Pirellulales bacterium]|jgi:CBS domain-containing protein|nr:CBS domain-containing protein [Pirellulales bacterium]
MKLADILAHKGYKVHSIRPSAMLAEVVQVLVRHNIGSLMVCENEDCKRMLGIITERDILRACAARRGPLETTRVSEVMTTNVVTGSPCDSVEDTMGLMTEHRIRHLPVLENDELVGIVSIGDIVKAQHDALTMENHYLKSYLHG